MKMLHARVAVLLLALSLVPISAGATILTFEGHEFADPITPVESIVSWTEQGYRFTVPTFSLADLFIVDSEIPSVVNNGTDILGWCVILCGGRIFLERIDGAEFDLNSFDATNLFDNATTDPIKLFINSNPLTLGGFEVTLEVDEWKTFDLPHDQLLNRSPFLEFTHLTWVSFAVDNDIGRFGAAFDNINVSLSNPPASVPEPGTLILMSLGLIGLGFNRRKKLQ